MLCITDTCFCFFWAGFNLTALDVIGARSPSLAALGAPRIASDVFLPLALCQNGCKLGVSLLLIDRMSTRKRALATAWSGVLVAAVAATSLSLRSEAGVLCWSIVYGLTTGAYIAFSEVIHASLFGTVALGRILGLARAFGTFSTGVGPVLFAASHDQLGGSYDVGIIFASASLLLSSLVMLLLAGTTLRGVRTRREAASPVPLRVVPSS